MMRRVKVRNRVMKNRIHPRNSQIKMDKDLLIKAHPWNLKNLLGHMGKLASKKILRFVEELFLHCQLAFH